MKRLTTRRRTLQSAALVLMLQSGSIHIAQAGLKDDHIVEFAEVEGRDCLQPVKTSADATLDDFHAAEQRWLRSHLPGRQAPHSEIALWPTEGDSPLQARDVRTETLYVEALGGSDIAVCFAFNKQ